MPSTPKVPSLRPPNGTTVGLGAVLEHGNAVAIGDGHDALHVAGRAGHVDRHDQPRAGSDLALQVLRIHAETVVDLAQDRDGVGLHDRPDRRDPEEGRHDDLAAGTDSQGGHRREQRACAATYSQREFRVVERRAVCSKRATDFGGFIP